MQRSIIPIHTSNSSRTNATGRMRPAPHTLSGLDQNDDRLLGQYIPLLYHYNMLQDEDRVGAFKRAIELLVKPDMHVVELGAGTGILSSFAARRGASVTCVERNPELVAYANQFLKLNHLHENTTVYQADAMHFSPDRPVDVVVCEMLHVGLLREKQAQVIDAFKRNYLNQFGGPLPVFIPEVSMLMMQPVEHDFNYAGYCAPVPTFQAPVQIQPRTRELANLIPYANIGYADSIPMRYETEIPFELRQDGILNAVRFVTQNVLTVDMDAQEAIAWPNQCLVLPLEPHLPVSANQTIKISLCYSAGGSVEELWQSLSVSIV